MQQRQSPRARESDRLARTHRWQARQLELAEPDAAYDTGDVSKTLEHHRAHRSPKVLRPPRKGAQLARDSAGTRPRHRHIRARARVGQRKGVRRIGRPQATQGGDDVPPRQGPPGLSEASEGTGVPESRGEVGVQNPEHPDGARDPRWRDDRMTGRRSHGRRSALNGVVPQGSVSPAGAPYAPR